MTRVPRAPRALSDFSWLVLFSLVLVAVSFWGCDPAYAARGRAPTIEATFTATCHQVETCAAPAVVRLNASATTAEGVARPFHELRYSWDCGHGGAAPVDGPISACVYDRPGIYSAILRVEQGEEAALAAQRVIVLDRSAVRVVELAPGSRQASVALGAGPGLLTTRAGGAPAVITGALSPPDGWTVAGVDLEGGCVSIPPERSRVTLIDVHARNCRQGAYVTQTGGGTRHSDLLAIARSTLSNAPGVQVPAIFARAERMTVIESDLRADYYPVRTVHFPGLVLARNRLEASGAHNCAQLRGWSGTGPPNSPSERFVVAENECVTATPSTAFWRTCRSNTCTGAGIAEIRDGIFRGNRSSMAGISSPPPSIGYWIEGSDLTIEGDTFDAPAANMGTAGTVRLVQQFGAGGDRVTVRGVRAVLPRGARAAVACELRGSGHVCDGNTIERTP